METIYTEKGFAERRVHADGFGVLPAALIHAASNAEAVRAMGEIASLSPVQTQAA